MDSMKLLRIIGATIVFLQLITGIIAWGNKGHYITCKIAENYMTKNARIGVQNLLPESAEGELTNVCSWADLFDVRIHRYWSRALHYVDTPDFQCNYQYCRDCHDFHPRMYRCVTAAIYNYTMELYTACRNPTMETDSYNLTEALMFLSHFVGDVHQPLHVGFIGDLGGNKIDLQWFNKKANLHHVWDTEIIDTAVKRFYGKDVNNMTEAIISKITNDERKSWGACRDKYHACPDPYAAESVDLACKYAYKNATPGSTLEDDYFLSRLPVVEQRLAQGGVRLAYTLNRIFDSCELFKSFNKRGTKQPSQDDIIDENEEIIESYLDRIQVESFSKLTADIVPKCPASLS